MEIGLTAVDVISFGEALIAMKQGKKAARCGWNGADMFACYSPGSGMPLESDGFWSPPLKDWVKKNGPMIVRPCLLLKTAQDDVAYWSPSTSDAIAEDWFIVE